MKQLSTQLDQELEIKNFTLTQNVIRNQLEQFQLRFPIVWIA